MIAQASPIAATSSAGALPARKTAPAQGPSLFHQILSELNPLQYLPVIGTIYRAITGDTIPQAARMAGSLVVSGLTGGPIGIALNLGATMAEHLLGIDPEKIGTRLMADLGIGHASGVASPAQPTHLAASAPANSPQSIGLPPVTSSFASLASITDMQQPVPRAWSVAQLTAYGIRTGATGEMTRGTLSGAELLNTLELARLRAGNAIA